MQLDSFSHWLSFSVKGPCYCVAILACNNVLVAQSVDKKFRSIGTCLLPVSSSGFFRLLCFHTERHVSDKTRAIVFRIKYKFYQQDAVNLSVSFCFTFFLRAFGLSFAYFHWRIRGRGARDTPPSRSNSFYFHRFRRESC